MLAKINSVPNKVKKMPSITINGKSINRSEIESLKQKSKHKALPSTSKPTKNNNKPINITSETSINISEIKKIPSLASSSSNTSAERLQIHQITPTKNNLGNMKRPTISSISNKKSVTKPMRMNISLPKSEKTDVRSIPKPRIKKPEIPAIPPAVPPSKQSEKKTAFIPVGNSYIPEDQMPKFDLMKSEELIAYKQDLLRNIREIQINYPELNVIMPESDDIKEYYAIYYTNMKTIIINKSIGTPKMILLLSWVIFEIVATNYLNINMTGYSDMMINEMVRYELLLKKIKEKSFRLINTGSSLDEDPLTELIKASLYNAILIIAINKIGGFVFSDKNHINKIRETAGVFVANHFCHPSMPRPPNADEIKREEGILGTFNNMIDGARKLFIGVSDDEKQKIGEPKETEPGEE